MSDMGIVADPRGGIYPGGFFNHFMDGDHLTCAEKMAGQPDKPFDQAIAIRFMSLAEGGDFPKEEVERMHDRGGALFIKLEPWTGAGPTDKSFDLDDLRAGKFDKLIISFAKSCQDVGKPILLTFGHEPQITKEYPWGKDPEVYKAAFRYVHDLINKYTNRVTWVWNPNVVSPGEDLFKYDPGPGYYKWIALDGYHPRSGGSFKSIFESSLQQITATYPNLDIMIGEFASNAPDRTAIFNETFDYLAGTPHRIKAFLYFDVNERGNNWAILKPKDQIAYAAALQKHEAMFRHTIQLEGGSSLKREKVEPLKAPCAEVEGTWHTLYWQRRVEGLERDIRLKEKCFTGIINYDQNSVINILPPGTSIGRHCDNNEDNLWHSLLAKSYVELAVLQGENEPLRDKYIQLAQRHLEIGLLTSDDNDVKPNRPSIPKVRYYFELKMQLAETYRNYGRTVDSIALGREVLSPRELKSAAVRRAHDVGDESVGGYDARTRGIIADGILKLGKAAQVDRAKLDGLVPANPLGLWIDLVNSGNLNAKGIVQPANFNSEEQVAISGEIAAVELALEIAKQKNAKRAMTLQVGGAFHSPLMESAKEGMIEVLNKIKINPAQIPIVSNVYAKPMKTPDEIKEALIQQIVKPVLWYDSIKYIYQQGAKSFLEVGPGKVLQGLIKRSFKDAQNFGVDKLLDLDKFLELV